MFHAIQSALTREGMARAVLLVNHVLASEPAAAQRLRAHVGRRLRLQLNGWPGWLPPLPDLTFRVTPAALVEWTGEPGDAPADLQIELDASNPAKALLQALAGERPHVEVAGDAAFATDVNWLFDHLRWDIEDDLAKIVGPAPAREMARLGGVIATGLRDAVNGVGSLAQRIRRGGPAGR
jgi:ubiquinone biosynthesis protein UbiJ